MHKNSLRQRVLALVVGITALAFSGWASADPPSRVARLGYVSGAVSFSPAGENDWVQATLNRPLTTGDRLWADPGARAEIQVGGAMVRMNAGTSVSVLNLDDQITQLQLTQGTLNVRVLRLERDQMFEVDTPNVAFTLRQPGEYRIEVDPEGQATTIVVRRGQGEVYGDDAAFVIDARQPYRFMGTGMREYQHAAVPQPDEFDRWTRDRDRRYETSVSARYVSPDVVGYQDLDANGVWRVDATYGNVWVPNRVAAGWSPYSDGHWAWVHPWGWTWVDNAPWGFAVSHYGRWAHVQGTWGWIPGPVRTRAYYAPALVVFIGGANFQLSISSGNVGGVGWFPLGPREVYQPAYPVSRRYYEDINRSNTVINNTVINNTYNNINVTNVVYANQRVPGAVVAVPTTAFVQSQPVSRAAVRVSQDVIVSAPVTVVPVVAPTERSVRGNADERNKPPARALDRKVVARTAPPAAPVGFAAQQPQLIATPGKPLDESARRELKPAVAAPAVKVIEANVAPPTTRLPPAKVGPATTADGRGKPDDRKAAAAAPVAESGVAPPAPAAQPPSQRERADQPGKGNQPRAPSPPVAAPAPPVPPQVAPAPTAASPPPVAQPPSQRERADQPGKGNQQRAPSPPVAPQVIAPPAPTVATPPPVTQTPSQRERPDQPGKGNQQRAPSPPVAAPQPPPVAPQVITVPTPTATPPSPAAPPPNQRERPDQPGKGSQQRAPSPPVAAPAPPPAPPQVKAAPVPNAPPPAPAAQPPQQRDKDQPGKGGQRTPPVATPPPPPPAAPQAAVPAVPKAAGPADQRPASKSADMKKDKEKDKEDAKP